MSDGPEGEECISAEDRKKILSRLHSLFFWVGEQIPEEVVLGDGKVPLKEVVFRFISEPAPSEETVSEAHELALLLETKAKEMCDDLTKCDMEKIKAYMVMHEALGILRAVDQLRNVKPDACHLKAQSLVAKVSDERRWLDFVRKIKPN